MDKCLWVCAGYPVLVGAIVALWTAYRGERKETKAAHKETRAAELLLIEEKDRHVRELEAFLKIVEDRQGGAHGRKPF